MKAGRFLRICCLKARFPAQVDEYTISSPPNRVVLLRGKQTLRTYLERGFSPHKLLAHICQDIQERLAR